MILVLSLLVSGLVAFSIVLTARWLEWWLWHRQLTAYCLELPRGLTRDEVNRWLAALGAATRHIPAVVEINADGNGIRHYLAAPQRHVRLLVNQTRTLLPGVRTEQDASYFTDDAHVRAAGELRVTSTSHPLGHERAVGMAGALLSALQPLETGQRIRVSWLLAGTATPHPAGLAKLAPDLARFRRNKQRSPLLRACGRIERPWSCGVAEPVS